MKMKNQTETTTINEVSTRIVQYVGYLKLYNIDLWQEKKPNAIRLFMLKNILGIVWINKQRSELILK